MLFLFPGFFFLLADNAEKLRNRSKSSVSSWNLKEGADQKSTRYYRRMSIVFVFSGVVLFTIQIVGLFLHKQVETEE
jgi:hypothetical protein